MRTKILGTFEPWAEDLSLFLYLLRNSPRYDALGACEMRVGLAPISRVQDVDTSAFTVKSNDSRDVLLAAAEFFQNVAPDLRL